ncbi:MAG: CinA family protein [Heliobacteriaceae bacterium]|jgi:PncC family amidohydrolase|nr:CinA family protein [Heliobacteriaceae bacterium]
MLNFAAKILQLTSRKEYILGKILMERGLQLRIAESCTGGLLSSRLTDVSGSSAYTRANFVTYSDEAKRLILGVSKETLKKYGAVSEECAREMAEGLAAKTGCDIAVCTTGIAGPSGGTYEKPAGTVYIAVFFDGKTTVKKFSLSPRLNRKNMKFMFTEKALETVLQIITECFYEI